MKKRWKAALSLTAFASLLLSALSPISAQAEEASAPAAYNAGAAAISLPSTVPSLDGFVAGEGTWTLTNGARVVSSPQLAKRASLLSTELSAFGGFQVPAIAVGSAATSKDVHLVLDDSQTELGEEGFKLEIGANGLVVTAKTDAGVFYGTRAVSQLLRQESRGDQKLTLPAGSVTSVPKYKERGVILCACQINISTEWIERFLDDIADLRINQILLEMKLKSETYPDTNTWSYYTPEEVARFVAKAKEYNIDVIPEINSPGHMGIWLENSPQYQLVSSSGTYKATGLDISKPEARALYKKLIDEYDEAFDTKYWHMGADEYMIHDRYSNYPQLLQYARDTFGPDAREDDAFIAFINEVNQHVKSKGKTLRVFNDGINLRAQRKVDTDVIIDYWLFQYNSNIYRLVEQGYKLMNTTQALYWSRQDAYGVNTQNLYNGTWNVGTFDSNKQINKDYAGLLGARVSLWPDNSYMTENEVAMQTSDSIAFLAQMTWSDSRPWPRWEGAGGMKEAVDSVGKPFIRSKVAGADIPNGVYSFPELSPVNAGPWQITKTYDDYYQVKNTQTNTCLTIDQTEGKHLSVVTEVAAGAVLAACKDMSVQWPNRASDEPALRVHQKWQIVPVGNNKVTFRNAVTNQYLAVADGTERHVDIQGVSAPEVRNNPTLLNTSFSGAGKTVAVGSVVQFPRDVISTDGALADKAKFSLGQEMGILISPTQVTEVDPTTPAELTVTVFAPQGQEIGESTITPQVSEGWRIAPSEVTLPAMSPGDSAVAKFKVQNVTSTEGTVTFTWNTEVANKTATANLSGVVGPRLCGAGFNNISASSEELRGEGNTNGRIGAAFDVRSDGSANENTFWHSQWDGAFGQFPFWVVFNPTEALAGKNMTTLEYRPRVGKVNGRIKNYNIYLSETELAGNADGWGAPVVTGEFQNNGEWQKAVMPENTRGQFVKLEITDVWDERPPTEDQFASAAAFCVASQVPPVELTAPEQPAEPVTPAPTFVPPASSTPATPISLLFSNDQAEALLEAEVGTPIDPISFNFTVDSSKPYTLTANAELPAGLSLELNGNTGTISGNPTGEFEGEISYTLTQGELVKTIVIAIAIANPVSPEEPTPGEDPGAPGEDPGAPGTDPGSSEPGTGGTDPGSSDPSTGTEDPSAPGTDPGSSEPGTGGTDPGSSDPSTGTEDPGTSTEDPGTPSTDPATPEAPATKLAALDKELAYNGDKVVVTGKGFQADEKVEIWLHSTPILLAQEVRANANGELRFEFNIPAEATVGAHHVVIKRTQTKLADIELALEVLKKDTVKPPLTDSKPVVAAPKAPATVKPVNLKGGLAHTGATTSVVAFAMLLLLAAGGALTIARRKES